MPASYGFNMGYTAVFEKAALIFDLNPNTPLTLFQGKDEAQKVELPAGDGYFGEIQHMLDCIEQGRNPTISTPQESRDAVALALAEKKSILTGKPVEI
jgi:predicted dehydrogenase